jgi:hypothetical protein
MSRFFAEPVADPRAVTIRRLTTAAVIVALLGAVGIAVKRAFDYHGVYTQRIEAQERELAKGSNGEVKKE